MDIAGAEALAAATHTIDEALGGPAEAPPLPAATAPPKGRAAAAAAPGGHGGDGEGGADGSGGGGGDLEFVDLGGMKRVSISRYGGRLSVDLREYYQVRQGMGWWWVAEDVSVGLGALAYKVSTQPIAQIMCLAACRCGRKLGNASNHLFGSTVG